MFKYVFAAKKYFVQNQHCRIYKVNSMYHPLKDINTTFAKWQPVKKTEFVASRLHLA